MTATEIAECLARSGRPAVGKLWTYQAQVSTLAQAIDQLGEAMPTVKQPNILAMKKPLMELAWGTTDGMQRRWSSQTHLSITDDQKTCLLRCAGKRAGKEEGGGA
jgi:uncharacterized protein